jgi:transposase
MTTRLGIGIDVSKDKVDVASSDGALQRRIKRAPPQLRALAKELCELDAHRVVVEASGGYEREVLQVCHAAGLPVVLIEPSRSRKFAGSIRIFAKTDAIDAAVLAEMARYAVDTDRLWKPAREELEELTGLTKRRHQLVLMVEAERKRRTSLRGPARASIDRHLKTLIKERNMVTKQLQQGIAEAEEVRELYDELTQTYGVGPVVGATLICFVPELGTLSRKQASALVGLAPYNRDSGNRSLPRHIRGGRAPARHVLYMAALTATRQHGNPICSMYSRLRSRGKPHKVAMVACMRKMLIHLNSRCRKFYERRAMTKPVRAS